MITINRMTPYYVKFLFITLTLLITFLLPKTPLLATSKTQSFVCNEKLTRNSSSLENQIVNIKKRLKYLKNLPGNLDHDLEAQVLAKKLYALMLKQAKIRNSRSVKSEESQSVLHLPMLKSDYYRVYYRGSSTSSDLPDEEYKQFQVYIKDGKLVNFKEKLISTKGGRWIYCIQNGKMYISVDGAITQSGEFIRHPTLCKGQPVIGAGELIISKGLLVSINTNSGRYRLPPFSIEQVKNFMITNGVSIEETKFDFYYRETAYLSPYDLTRIKEAGGPITDNLLAAVEYGKLHLQDILKRVHKVDSKTGTNELLDIQDFLIDWGTLNEENKEIITSFFLSYILSGENKMSRRLNVLREFYRNVPFLNGDRIELEFKKFLKDCKKAPTNQCTILSDAISDRYIRKLGLFNEY